MKNLIGAEKDEWITSFILRILMKTYKAFILVERLPIFAVALFRALLLWLEQLSYSDMRFICKKLEHKLL